MGLFKNLSQTRVFGDNYFKHGRYIVRINKVKAGKNRKSIPNIVIETTILAVLPSSEPPPYHVVGDEPAQVMSAVSDYIQSQWAHFISTALDVQISELDNPEIKQYCGGGDLDDWASNEDPAKGMVQPLRGKVMELTAICKATKKDLAKPDKPEYLTNFKWHRCVTRSEVQKLMTPENMLRYFPGNALTLVDADPVPAA